MALHPASWLAAWALFAVVAQRLSLPLLLLAAALILPLSLAFARQRTLALLRRARWLLLAIAVLFVWATPGERLEGPLGALGITVDGLRLGSEHVLRLVAMLAALAWLLAALGREGVLAGLYRLLAPLANWRRLRDRIVVRLLLALEYAESDGSRNWRDWLGADHPAGGAEKLLLSVPALRARDAAVLTLSLGGALAALALS